MFVFFFTFELKFKSTNYKHNSDILSLTSLSDNNIQYLLKFNCIVIKANIWPKPVCCVKKMVKNDILHFKQITLRIDVHVCFFLAIRCDQELNRCKDNIPARLQHVQLVQEILKRPLLCCIFHCHLLNILNRLQFVNWTRVWKKVAQVNNLRFLKCRCFPPQLSWLLQGFSDLLCIV